MYFKTEMPSPAKKKLTWLLLLFRLPATHKAERVAVWRKLKKSGAIQIKTSTYLLPDEPARHEYFQWLSQQIRDAGGDATLVRAREIEGLPNEELVELFNAARASEYAMLNKTLRALHGRSKNAARQTLVDELDRIRKRFREIRETDFFNSARAHEIEMLLRKGEGTERNRPAIDRVGSAWLIRKFIDPEAKFVFASKTFGKPGPISFDMLGADFSHHGEDCTFETLSKRFGIQDKVVRQIGEMIHEADLGDAKFQRNECIGLDRIFKGWAKQGMADDEILNRGFQCFDGLYAFLRRL